MKSYVIRPYEPRDRLQVVELMTRARRERRRACPLLPAGLDEAAAAARLLDGEDGGVVATSREGDLAGFLFAKRQEDPDWGAAVIADVDRWALAPEANVTALAKLYAAAFEPRMQGATEHRVYCPASDERMLAAWFQLGFGMEQAYAVARLEELDTDYGDAGLEIRRARSGDEEILASLSPLIAAMHAAAPVWAGAPPSYFAGLREGYMELATDQEAIVLLAFRGHKAVGHQAWFPVAADPIDGVTESAVELAVGATVPEERGTGVGRALTARGVAEARRAGYSVCFTDWRTANPLSSAFFPARGFRPYKYRLVRRLAHQTTSSTGGTVPQL